MVWGGWFWGMGGGVLGYGVCGMGFCCFVVLLLWGKREGDQGVEFRGGLLVALVALLVCIDSHWFALVCIGCIASDWFALVCIGLNWLTFVCFGLYLLHWFA